MKPWGVRSSVVALVTTSALVITGCSTGRSGHSTDVARPSDPSTTGAGSTGAAPAVDYRAARSSPVMDSYYPQHGVPYLDTLHYGLKLDWQPGTKTLTGVATIALRVTTERTSIRFDLGAPLQVTRATVDGKAVGTSRSGNYLTIRTPELPADSRHTVVIDYSGRPMPVRAPAEREDVQHVGFTTAGGGAAYTFQEPFGAFTWYPVNDQPADKAFYDATLISHDGQRGVFNGQVVSSTAKGSARTTKFHLDQPASSYLTTVAFGDYRHETATGPHGLPINYWYTAGDTASLPLIRKTPQIIAWAEKQLGTYPFASTGVVLVPGNSAMETQTLVTMTNSVRGIGGRDVYRGDYAHELFHSWFGDEVSPTDWKDVWLNESLTMFMQFRYMASHNIPNKYGSWRELQSGRDQLMRDTQGPPGAYRKNDFGDLNVYLSGALMLHNLEKAYGAAKFNVALKGWPATHKYGNASRTDFINYMDKALGPKAGPYIKHWLTAKKTPAPLSKQS